jgi:hypothetical protein
MFPTEDVVSGGSGGHVHIQTVNMTDPGDFNVSSHIFKNPTLAEGGNANDNNQGMGGSGGRIVIAFTLKSSEALLIPNKVYARGGSNPNIA